MEKERSRQHKEVESEMPVFMKLNPFDGSRKEETKP
jgi:hypothetical protein